MQYFPPSPMLVYRRWNDIINAYPKLWDTLVVDFNTFFLEPKSTLRWLQHIVAQARGVGLHIFLSNASYELPTPNQSRDQVNTLLRYLFSTSARWETLLFQTSRHPTTDSSYLLGPLRGRLSKLQHLRFATTISLPIASGRRRQGIPRKPISAFEDAPHLRNVEILHMAHVFHWCPLPWKRLIAYASVGSCIEDCIRVLVACPLLENLTDLQCSALNAVANHRLRTSFSLLKVGKVILPKLEQFSVEGQTQDDVFPSFDVSQDSPLGRAGTDDGLYDFLTCSSLKTARFRSQHFPDGSWNNMVLRFNTANLRFLELPNHSWISSDGLDEFLPNVPRLEYLPLGQITNAHLTILTYNGRMTTAPKRYVPLLRFLRFVWDSCLSLDRLSSLLQSRGRQPSSAADSPAVLSHLWLITELYSTPRFNKLRRVKGVLQHTYSTPTHPLLVTVTGDNVLGDTHWDDPNTSTPHSYPNPLPSNGATTTISVPATATTARNPSILWMAWKGKTPCCLGINITTPGPWTSVDLPCF